MMKLVRIASAALLAAVLVSCGDDPASTSQQSAVCSGRATGYWAGTGGQSLVTRADLDYVGTFDACKAFGAFGTAAQLAQYLAAADAAGAAPRHVLCAEWFAFALNARHGRFACGGADVLFAVGDGRFTFAQLETTIRAALASGDVAALTGFLGDANGGDAVCVCATGATGGSGGTGSWGE